MNAGYFVGKWVENLLKKSSASGVIKTISAYIGATLARKLVTAVLSGASTTTIGTLIGAKLGALSGVIGAFIVGLAGAL